MKTVLVTDALAAKLVEASQAEYVTTPEVLHPSKEHAALLPAVKMIAVNGVRVDLPCPQGTPDTVTITATGHTLSKPNVDKGEMFVGYCQRVCRQAGAAGFDSVGELMLGTTPFFEPFGGFKADGSNWPQAADFFYNRRSLMSTAELAADDRAKQGFADVGKLIGEQRRAEVPQQGAPSEPDKVVGGETEVPIGTEQS